VGRGQHRPEAVAAGEGIVDVRHVGVLVIRRYLGLLHRRKLDPASIGRKIAAFRSFFGIVARMYPTYDDPMEAIRSPKKARKLPRVLSVDDVFAAGTTMELTLRFEEFQTDNVARLTTSDGLFADAPLLSIGPLWHDTLSGLTFPAGRLRSGMYWVRASAAAPPELANREILAVLSLMNDGSVEVRLISGTDRLYGLFRLRKESTD
jgi:hypothetical protein